jgi:hypothetical protein
MRNGGDITALFQFLCFGATVSVSVFGGHEPRDLAHPARKYNEDRMSRMTIKRA